MAIVWIRSKNSKFKSKKKRFFPQIFTSSFLTAFTVHFTLFLVNCPPTAAWDDECPEPNSLCTCSMKDMLEFFNTATVISRSLLSRTPDIVTRKIQNYECTDYETLPSALELKWSSVDDEYRRMSIRKNYHRRRYTRDAINYDYDDRETDPKILHGQRDTGPYLGSGGRGDRTGVRGGSSGIFQKKFRRKRQIGLGYPSNDLFSEVIPSLPERSLHKYVPLGAEAILHCFGNADVIEESPWLERTFHWFHASGNPVTAAGTSIDKNSGDLTFASVYLSDSDIYTCQITYKNEESDSDSKDGNDEIISYSHQLDVVAEPIAWLSFSVIYTTQTCNHEELLLVQDALVKWVHEYICFFCPVRNNSVSCILKDEYPPGYSNEGLSETYRDIKIRLAISTLGMEHRMTSFHSYSEACPLACVESLHMKLLQVARNSLESLFSLDILVESSQNKITRYVPQLDTSDSDLKVGCPAGFFENYKLCFPCPSGQFSPHGTSECSKCPLGRFQPAPGASVCMPCPEGYGTSEIGSVAEFDCKFGLVADAIAAASAASIGTIFLLIFLIGGPIMLLICCIPYCFPDSKLGKWFAICSCFARDPSEYRELSGNRKNSRNSFENGVGNGEQQYHDDANQTEDDEVGNNANVNHENEGMSSLKLTKTKVTVLQNESNKQVGMKSSSNLEKNKVKAVSTPIYRRQVERNLLDSRTVYSNSNSYTGFGIGSLADSYKKSKTGSKPGSKSPINFVNKFNKKGRRGSYEPEKRTTSKSGYKGPADLQKIVRPVQRRNPVANSKLTSKTGLGTNPRTPIASKPTNFKPLSTNLLRKNNNDLINSATTIPQNIGLVRAKIYETSSEDEFKKPRPVKDIAKKLDERWTGQEYSPPQTGFITDEYMIKGNYSKGNKCNNNGEQGVCLPLPESQQENGHPHLHRCLKPSRTRLQQKKVHFNGPPQPPPLPPV